MTTPIIGTRLVPIDLDAACHRCQHRAKYHAGPDRGSVCMVAVQGPAKDPKAKRCFCDGLVVTK